MKKRRIPRWELYPNEFSSPLGWISMRFNRARNFVHAALHPKLTKPWTLRKYLHVMRLYHRCIAAFWENHRLMRRNFGHSDPSAFGYQRWQEDPNWEVKISVDPTHEDSKAPRSEADGSDDRADSDPPKRRRQ